MKKIINLILVISIICMLFKMFFILNVNENRLKYNYNEIKLLVNKSDINVAHKTFSQFDEYFTDVPSPNTYNERAKKVDDYYTKVHRTALKSVKEMDDGKKRFTAKELQFWRNRITVVFPFQSNSKKKVLFLKNSD